MMATTTTPTLSGTLRVSFSPAQTKFCHPSRLHNPLIISKTCNAGEDEREQSSGSVKPENYSGSAKHYCYSGLTEHKHCLGLNNEKGRTANPTLWGIYSFNYESFVVHISTYTKSAGQPSGDSLAFLRCLRLISPNIAKEINCPVLSP